MNDWLALPGAEQSAAEKKQEPVVIDIEPKVPVVSNAALAVVERDTKIRETFARAWRQLKPRQRIYLQALLQCQFSRSRALKRFKELEGVGMPMTTPVRWERENEAYRLVLAAMKEEAATQVTSRSELLLRAHRAAEYAEDEQPILYQGADTGFRERKPDSMLRANEQLMKATKVLGGDENRVQVAIGPALIVQVVQGDGSVKDVTPRGVVVDLPQPA